VRGRSGRRAERQAGGGPVRGACAANPRSRRVYEWPGARNFFFQNEPFFQYPLYRSFCVYLRFINQYSIAWGDFRWLKIHARTYARARSSSCCSAYACRSMHAGPCMPVHACSMQHACNMHAGSCSIEIFTNISRGQKHEIGQQPPELVLLTVGNIREYFYTTI
jgi:hypothetical protein